MTWAVLLSMIIFSLIKILMTCLPTGVVEWMFNHFRVHPKLHAANTTVRLGERNIEGEEKERIIRYLNEATFFEKYYIWPGTEQSYLNPENKGIPIIVRTLMGKKELNLYVFINKEKVEAVKQFNKKYTAYSLRTENFYRYLQAEIAD